MIRKLDTFVGLIGWKQGNLEVTLDTANLDSSTSRRYEDFSSLITSKLVYDTWNDYSVDDDLATRQTKFNNYLRDKVNESISQVFNSVFGQTEDLIENSFLYPYEQDLTKPLNNATDFVGFEVDISRDKNYTTVINNIKATFDADGSITVFLFNASKKAFIESQVINVVANDTVIQDVEWYLPFDYSGKYYIGYLRDGLVPKGLDRQYELANVRKSFTCSYFDEIRVDGHNSNTMFDVNDITHDSKTWGLNFDVSTYKDWTEVAINNKNKFVDAIGLQVAVNVLDLFINSSRSNRDERISDARVRLVLEGNSNPELGLFTQGIRTRLQEEVNKLRELFTEQKIIERGTLK